MGKKAKALCVRVLLCLCCKSLKTASSPQPQMQCGQNQSTVSHLDNSVNMQEKWDQPRSNSKPDGRSASVSPIHTFPKSTIVTGTSVPRQVRMPTVPVSKSLVEERNVLEDSQHDSVGRYLPVSFSESSVHSFHNLPSSPSDARVEFCDKNSDLSSQQDLALAEQNLQAAQFELNEEEQFPELQQDELAQVVRGVNFRELMRESPDSDLPNIVLDRPPGTSPKM